MSRTPIAGPPPLGVVLAGGGSVRYGAPKALATVNDVRIVDRVVAALAAVTPDLVVSANEPGLFEDLGLPIVPDATPGLGPLAGIRTMLERARAEGRPGVLAVACDLPFPCVPLLHRLVAEAFPGHGGPDAAPSRPGTPPDLVIPESDSRRGVEPLFAAYGTGCIGAIDEALAEGDRRMIGFHDRVVVSRVSRDEVASLCDTRRAFLNVNTPEERERAEAMAQSDERDG